VDSRQRTFWSTISWPRKEGILVLVGGTVAFFVVGFLYAGLSYGAISAAFIFPVFLILWAMHRVLKAWAEWPAQHRGTSWLKAAVRYLLTDS
jgi:uncharacterized membrane protein HdeD (DUF308 family)